MATNSEHSWSCFGIWIVLMSFSLWISHFLFLAFLFFLPFFLQESLARLQRAFARKWEFIFMQAEAQAKWVHWPCGDEACQSAQLSLSDGTHTFSQSLIKTPSLISSWCSYACQFQKKKPKYQLIFFLPVSSVAFRVDKKRDKIERKILDSQERAFWDVHRPVVCLFTYFCSFG